MRIAGAAAAAFVACNATAAPFPTRDQNPLLAGFGLHAPLPAAIAPNEAWSAAVDLNWANTALVQSHGGESLLVDAETQELRLTLQRTLGGRFALQLQAPYRRISGGSLDSFIDDWHEFFGLPGGARRRLPQDALHILYVRNGAAALDLRSAASGLGDLAASLGYALRAGANASLTGWLSIELPTGDAAELAGNEALDASLSLAGERRFADRWSAYAQASVSWLGAGELLPQQQRDIVWSGVGGVSWRVSQPVELKIQLHGRTAAFKDSRLDFLNEAVMLTVGGALHVGSARIDLGVSEDIAVDTAPDVALVVGVGWRW